MPTRRSFRCPICGFLTELSTSLGEMTYPTCPTCGGEMPSYFGDRGGNDVLINYGYRESRYQSEEAANIAKFQFTNL